MSKKPTLIIDLRPIQNNNYNGVTISSKNWIEAILESKKFKVILWSNSIKKYTPPKSWLESSIHIHTKIPNKLLSLTHSLTPWLKIDKLTKTKTDKYFCPDLRPFNLSKKIQSFVYIHDMAFVKRKKDFSLKTRLWYKLINPKKIYNKASTVITNSKFSKTEILSELGKHNIKIIEPFLSKDWYTHKNNSKALKYFVTVSTLNKRKNLERTINGFLKFNKTQKKKYKLYIVGKHEDIFKKIQLSKNKYIKFTGQISEQGKINLIKNSSGLAYLSLYEGFGLPILETIKLCRPVLVSESSPFTQLYKNNGVYCDPYDDKSIKEGFDNLAKTKKVKDQSFSYTKSKNRLIKVLQS